VTEIIVVNAFRGGVGKSTIVANLAALMAIAGRRVAVVDIDFQEPGVNTLFDIEERPGETLNDYLFGTVEIDRVVYDATHRLDDYAATGKLFLVPSSYTPKSLKLIRRKGYDLNLLERGLGDLLDLLDLDTLIVKTPQGMSDQILLSVALADMLLVLLRPDYQDFQGTKVIVEAGRRLSVPDIVLIVNKTPPVYDLAQVEAEVRAVYGCDVGAVIPYAKDVVAAGGASGLFVLRYPDHPMAVALRKAAQRLMAVKVE
jgi:MinD-like ATPase involved in chromosome partitioning or flagellar assembly